MAQIQKQRKSAKENQLINDYLKSSLINKYGTNNFWLADQYLVTQMINKNLQLNNQNNKQFIYKILEKFILHNTKNISRIIFEKENNFAY